MFRKHVWLVRRRIFIRRAFKRALPIREEAGDRSGEMTTRWWLGVLHRAAGRLEEAASELQQAVDLAAALQSPHQSAVEARLAQVEAELAAQGAGK